MGGGGVRESRVTSAYTMVGNVFIYMQINVNTKMADYLCKSNRC